MKNKNISLAKQIKKVIGNRILFCCAAFMLIILGLTFYDVTISIKQLRSRINEEIKPIEDFAINQALINNLDTVTLKIESFNERHDTFKIKWVRDGIPRYKSIIWHFPFLWNYDYRIGEIAGYHFGYFNISGNFLFDKTLVYDLLLRLMLFSIFTISVLSILYPLAKKIPEQLFINPINRFIDLVSNNSTPEVEPTQHLPVELELLETKILGLLKTATEHERNKAAIEIGHLTARLAHDIHSPLAAMEMGLYLLTQKVEKKDLTIITNGIKCVREIANNVLERYRNPNLTTNTLINDKLDFDENISRPFILSTLVETVVSQKQHEWQTKPFGLISTINPESTKIFINAAPSEIKRLLSNLLNNAYDALIETKKSIIHIILEKVENTLRLQIEDNGIGIPSEKITDVLNGVSLKHPGNGLGLSGAKQYLENLNGKLQLTSKLEKGTKVTLIFPII